MKIYKTLTAMLLISGIYIACGKTESENSESDSSSSSSTNEPVEGTVGALSIPGASGENSRGMTGVSTQITTVESDMVPASLEVSTSNLTQSDNPCEGIGFFECQPNLLKVYVGMAKHMVASARSVVTNVKDFVDSLQIGASGVVEIPDAGDISKIHYNVESAAEISLLFESPKGVFLDFTISLADAGNQYRMKMDTGKAEGGDGALLDADITFVSDTNFTVDLKMTNSNCNAQDVRAPANIGIKIDFSEGVSQGKAMMYHPRWVGEVTCDTTPADSTEIYLFTDFAGNDTNTTASLYMGGSTFTDTASISTFEIQNFCTNFSGLCSGGMSMGDPKVIADNYINPFCVTGQATAWNGACTDFPVSSYSAASEWLAPATLKSYDVSIRANL